MRIPRSTRQKALPFLSIILIGSLLIFAIPACKEGGKKGSDSDTSNHHSSRGFKMNCVILTKAQVQNWVDSGWTKPGSKDKINNLLLQFYTGDAKNVNTNMQLLAYPGNSLMDIKLSGQTILGSDSTCVSKKLSDAIIFSNNEIAIDSLKIFNTDGSLVDFDFIRFVPEQFKENPAYINFSVEVIVNGQVDESRSGDTWPCPPYCIK